MWPWFGPSLLVTISYARQLAQETSWYVPTKRRVECGVISGHRFEQFGPEKINSTGCRRLTYVTRLSTVLTSVDTCRTSLRYESRLIGNTGQVASTACLELFKVKTHGLRLRVLARLLQSET
jgi:hypothetical protein